MNQSRRRRRSAASSTESRSTRQQTSTSIPQADFHDILSFIAEHSRDNPIVSNISPNNQIAINALQRSSREMNEPLTRRTSLGLPTVPTTTVAPTQRSASPEPVRPPRRRPHRNVGPESPSITEQNIPIRNSQIRNDSEIISLAQQLRTARSEFNFTGIWEDTARQALGLQPTRTTRQTRNASRSLANLSVNYSSNNSNPLGERHLLSEDVIVSGRELPAHARFLIQIIDINNHRQYDCLIFYKHDPTFCFRTQHGIKHWKYQDLKSLKKDVKKTLKKHGLKLESWIGHNDITPNLERDRILAQTNDNGFSATSFSIGTVNPLPLNRITTRDLNTIVAPPRRRTRQQLETGLQG